MIKKQDKIDPKYTEMKKTNILCRNDITVEKVEQLLCTCQSESWGEGLQGYDKGPSDHTGESDNSYSFQHHSDITNDRHIDLYGRETDSESKWQGGVLTDKRFLHQIPWVSPGAHRIHIDTCINDLPETEGESTTDGVKTLFVDGLGLNKDTQIQIHSEKSLARLMLFYSRNDWLQN